MLPLSVRLRATIPVGTDAASVPGDWLERCEGFRVDGPDGRLGTVSGIGRNASGDAAWLEVRAGLFFRRTTMIGFSDVELVEPAARRLILGAAAAADHGRETVERG
jgi:hypothetical protein